MGTVGSDSEFQDCASPTASFFGPYGHLFRLITLLLLSHDVNDCPAFHVQM